MNAALLCPPWLTALVLRCWPRRPLAAHLALSNIDADILVAPGPDHTTKEAALSLGLPDDSRVAKSVVFVVDDSKLVLAVARGCDRVSLPLLQMHCGASLVRLATPAEAENATGFKPGCIGPVSPAMLASVRVVVDELLLSEPAPVFAGAGMPGEHLRIAPAELRRASGASVAKLVERPPRAAARSNKPPRTAVQPALEAAPLAPRPSPEPADDCPSGHLSDPESRDVRTKPPRKVSADIWQVLRLNALAEDVQVELEVLRVRRQGKLLVFASVRERGAPAPAPLASGGAPARPRIEQLIAGRALVAAAGEERAAAVMRHVKAGAVFRARVRPTRGPKPQTSCVAPALLL